MTTGWREQKKAQLRQELLTRSLELFRAQGFESTTVQQIVERAGVAKGTFFNYFPTKEHILAEWYNGITFASIEAARAREFHSAEEAIGFLTIDMSSRASESPQLVAGKASIVPFSELMLDAEKAQRDEFSDFCVEHLERGVRDGELRPDLDVTLFTSIVIAVLSGTVREWVSFRVEESLPELLSERLAFVFRGAKADEGAAE